MADWKQCDRCGAGAGPPGLRWPRNGVAPSGLRHAPETLCSDCWRWEVGNGIFNRAKEAFPGSYELPWDGCARPTHRPPDEGQLPFYGDEAA